MTKKEFVEQLSKYEDDLVFYVRPEDPDDGPYLMMVRFEVHHPIGSNGERSLELVVEKP